MHFNSPPFSSLLLINQTQLKIQLNNQEEKGGKEKEKNVYL